MLSAAAIVAIFRFKIGMIPTLIGCCSAGLLLYVAGALS
jgi:chromate transporter